MHRPTRLKVTDINPHFTCVLCDGYLVDATTIVECLHSFCRTCIVRYLENSKFCPVCDVQVHKTKPLLSIRSDQTLQDIVYKLVPNLYQNEMQRRKEFYAQHPEAVANCSSEERGEGGEQRFFYAPDEKISLSLQYFSGSHKVTADEKESESGSQECPVRHLHCPAAFSVAHMKKFISYKFGLPPCYVVDIVYADHYMRDEYTLMDIAYIYAWKRVGPMKFYYTITKAVKRRLIVDDANQEGPSDQNTNLSQVATYNDEQMIKAVEEVEKMEVDETAASSAPSLSEMNTDSSKADDNNTAASDLPTKDEEAMDTTEPVSDISSSPSVPAVSARETISYNAVKVVSSADSTVLSTANGVRLKFIHCPEPISKPQSKKSGGKRGRRSSRYKSAPVQRLARLAPAPFPSPNTTVSSSCLASQPVTHQIAVGKLVPPVITSLAPTLVTTLVSGTSDTLCSVTQNSVTLPPVPCTTACGIAACSNTNVQSVVSNSLSELCVPTVPVCSSALTTSCSSEVCSSSSPLSVLPVQNPVSISLPVDNACLPTATDVSVKETAEQSSTTLSVLDSSVECPLPVSSTPSLPSNSVEPSTLVSTVSSFPVSSPLLSSETASPASRVSVTSVPTQVHSQMPLASDISKLSEETNSAESLAPISPKSSPVDTVSKTVSKAEPEQPVTTVCPESKCGEKDTSNTSPKNPVFCDSFSVDKKSESFKMSVKNSISAEFSDNDDLGCQADLVVDEQKMDSSDNDDDTDAALRKKITAIAEKEDEADATDDTEADSGRASDISSQARSSCDDDIGSPMPLVPVTETDRTAVKTSVASSDLSVFPLPVTSTSAATKSVSSMSAEENHRHTKSNKINHVINNLINRQEKKDTFGALDLSICTRKSGETPSSRPKPVANPVLDIKHRQQTYLPAPSKQHTACPPAPKHPTSSMLVHGFPPHHHNLLPSPMSVHGKSSHLQVPFHSTNLPFASPSRSVSSPSSTSGKMTPTFSANHSIVSTVPTAHQPMAPLLQGILPYGAAMMNSYGGRNSIPPVPLPGRSPPSSSQLKAILTSPQSSMNSKLTHASVPHQSKQTATSHHRKSSNIDSHRAKSPTVSNGRNSAPSGGLAVPVSHPKTPPSMSPHHRSASPAPSSKLIVPTTTMSSSYKLSSSVFKKSDNFKTYSRFKGSNLTVINPDPNGYRQKIVIKKLKET